MMNMMNMMKQAQNIQKKLKEAQEELSNMDIVETTADGLVEVTCDGKGLFKSIKLTPELINPDDPSSVTEDTIEMIEDVIAAAIHQTTEKAQKVMEEKMKSVTGGLSIPGLF